MCPAALVPFLPKFNINASWRSDLCTRWGRARGSKGIGGSWEGTDVLTNISGVREGQETRLKRASFCSTLFLQRKVYCSSCRRACRSLLSLSLSNSAHQKSPKAFFYRGSRFPHILWLLLRVRIKNMNKDHLQIQQRGFLWGSADMNAWSHGGESVGGCSFDCIHYISQFVYSLLWSELPLIRVKRHFLACRNVIMSFIIAILQTSEPEGARAWLKISQVRQNCSNFGIRDPIALRTKASCCYWRQTAGGLQKYELLHLQLDVCWFSVSKSKLANQKEKQMQET